MFPHLSLWGLCPGEHILHLNWRGPQTSDLAESPLLLISDQSGLTLCDPTDCSTPGLPVLHHLTEFAQTHALSWWYHPTNLILCRPLFLPPSIIPSIRDFSSESVLRIRWPVSASASDLPMNIHSWFPLGWTGLISLQFKALSRVFSNTTVQKHQFFGTQLSL